MSTNIGGLIGRFVRDESGTETVEWAIVAGLLIVAAAAAWALLGNQVKTVINKLITCLQGGNCALS